AKFSANITRINIECGVAIAVGFRPIRSGILMKLVAPCALRPGPGGWSKISEARTSRRALLAAKVLYLYEGLMTRQTCTSRAYLLKRLGRDGYGDLLAAVENGRLSAYAAAEAAGYVTRRPVIGTGSQGQAKRRAARGRDDGQLMELWLGPSQRGSRFRDEVRLRGAWGKKSRPLYGGGGGERSP